MNGFLYNSHHSQGVHSKFLTIPEEFELWLKKSHYTKIATYQIFLLTIHWVLFLVMSELLGWTFSKFQDEFRIALKVWQHLLIVNWNVTFPNYFAAVLCLLWISSILLQTRFWLRNTFYNGRKLLKRSPFTAERKWENWIIVQSLPDL